MSPDLLQNEWMNSCKIFANNLTVSMENHKNNHIYSNQYFSHKIFLYENRWVKIYVQIFIITL